VDFERTSLRSKRDSSTAQADNFAPTVVNRSERGEKRRNDSGVLFFEIEDDPEIEDRSTGEQDFFGIPSCSGVTVGLL